MEEPKHDPSCPMPSINLVYSYRLTNVPGKSIVGLRVDFPPNAMTPPHRHGGAAVTAYVVKGSLQNKMNDEPMKIIPEAGTWYEAPGCHHKISKYVSATEEAVLIATMVVDSEEYERDGMAALLQIDEEWRPNL